MKTLTLFLALFLSLLPEGTPVADYPAWEEVCYEVVDAVEEEAVIRISRTLDKQPQVLPNTVYTETFRESSGSVFYYPFHHYFERQWLTVCSLRL